MEIGVATPIQIGSFLVVLTRPVSLKHVGAVNQAFIAKISGEQLPHRQIEPGSDFSSLAGYVLPGFDADSRDLLPLFDRSRD